ncbi:D-isomer specific 2-hydroxyacid dehydrogenase [Lipomyces arxii]|uniref:D-isomer specific 2-hydroxyacid dehydrogenase n=1 Tax=Lipomyces arxii TaxID=56418 RepID=UPI0034CE1D11
MPHALLLGQLKHSWKEWEALGDVAKVSVCDSPNKAALIADLEGKYSDITAAYHFNDSPCAGLMDADIIKALPDTCKYVCHNGAGYDKIDVAACVARGIKVSNTPGTVDDATADVNFFLILGAIRNFNKGIANLREGKWLSGVNLAHDPEEKVLGILGMGGIGRAVKRRADAFGMITQYHNRTKLSDELGGGAKYVSFDELLATSDIISLNLPLNANTRHIISKEAFSKMKDGVVIVNTARGAVMDEDALVDALASGKVSSVGLDVFEAEPKIHPGLLSNNNVILLPHMGTQTFETQHKMEVQVIDNIRAGITTGNLLTIVPECAKMQ